MLDQLLSIDAAILLLISFLIGIVVGLTGMGGGALMTPALILFGIPPTTAVANDLVAACVTKSVGASVHWKEGAPNRRLATLLIVGSVPLAFAGAFIIDAIGPDDAQQEFVLGALGWTLLGAAVAYTLRAFLTLRAMSRGETNRGIDDDPPIRAVSTIVVGAIGGLLVGLTSVGSGSVIMVVLLLLYPTLSARRLVGTDLLQAVPLVLAAAISHVIVTGVDWAILIPLLIGGSPGTYLGARLAHWVSQTVVRHGLVIVLSMTALKMLGASAMTLGIAGATLLIFGPIAWALLRRWLGLAPDEGLDSPPDQKVVADQVTTVTERGPSGAP